MPQMTKGCFVGRLLKTGGPGGLLFVIGGVFAEFDMEVAT